MRAIDTHCHFSTREMLHEAQATFTEGMEKYYKMKMSARTPEEMANDFRQIDVKCMPTGWDAETATGDPALSHDYVASVIKRYPDVFINAWACVDPWKGKLALRELERAIKELGFIGAKFQQGAQSFAANDRHFYPLWEKCVELKIPVQLHTGTTGMGAGLPGGLGVRLKYYHPMIIDDLAADFPELTIIALHPSWPWQSEMIAVLLHKGNVFNELSGWAPKYFSPELVREIGGRLQDKFMFGSDYPAIPPKRWLDEFEGLGFKPEVIEKVFYKNAERILKLKLS